MPEHFMIGEIGDLTVPSQGAEIWYLSHESYGQALLTNYPRSPADGVGNDCLLLRESDDYAPAGATGKCRLRRVFVVVGVQFGFARVRITPIVDFERELTPFAVYLPPPSGAKRAVVPIEIPVYANCTYVRTRFEVLERGGRVEWLGLDYGYLPVVQVAAQVAGSG